MKSITYITILLFFKSFCQKPPMETTKETYFGVEIKDNYRNFENLKDTLVLDWIKTKSNEINNIYTKINGLDKLYNKFDNFNKSRKNIYRQITYNASGKLFYIKLNPNDLKQNLYYKNNVKESKELLIIDSNFLKNNKITFIKANHKGTLLAIGITKEGNEIDKIHLYDIEKKQMLPNVIENNWGLELGGIHWLDDDSGFYYTRLNSSDIRNKEYLKNNKAVLYTINKKKYDTVFFSGSKNVIKNNEEDFFMIKKITKNYIFSELGGASVHRDAYFAKKNKNQNTNFSWNKLYSKEDKITQYFVTNNDIYYLSELDNKNVISKTNLINPKFQNQNIIISSPKDEVIKSILCVNDKKYFTTVKNGIQTFFYQFDDKEYKKIELPIPTGSISDMEPIYKGSSELKLELYSWIKPSTRYIYKTKENIFVEENIIEKVILDGLENIRLEELVIKTHDGLDLPVSIIYNKDMVKNGKNRTIITAYGAYGYLDEPFFNVVNLMWVLDGGIYVTAHVRGGGAKGEAWYKGGYKATKSNSWKDVNSTTEYLIKEGYTSPDFIGLTGTSAGGITVSGAVFERPELYKFVNINNASLNRLRSETSANGINNSKEFGSVTKAEEFPHVLNMDAYHKIKPYVKYPTFYIKSGFKDVRIPVWHSAKFSAKLSEFNHEVYFDCDFDGGHQGTTTNKGLMSAATRQAFFYWQLGHPDYQLKE
jgi:prolyl oligopeptidase